VKAEVIKFQEKYKSISIRLTDDSNTLVFLQGLPKSSKYSTPFLVNHDGTVGVFIVVALSATTDLIGHRHLVSDQVNISKCLSAFKGKEERSFPEISLAVGLYAGSYKVRITIRVDFARLQEPRFTLKPCTFFTHFDHPLSILSCPQLTLSPEDMARPFFFCILFFYILLEVTYNTQLQIHTHITLSGPFYRYYTHSFLTL